MAHPLMNPSTRVALAAYLLVSLLSFGIMTQPELAALPAAASMAEIF